MKMDTPIEDGDATNRYHYCLPTIDFSTWDQYDTPQPRIYKIKFDMEIDRGDLKSGLEVYLDQGRY